MKKIQKMTDATREALLRASAQRLPDRPTAAGMTPDDIRRTLWLPMLGEELSLATEQDRIVDEVNEALSALAEEAGISLGALESALAFEGEERARVVSELRAALSALSERESARETARDAQMEELSDELSDALHEARQGLETAIDARVERKTVGTGKQSLYGVYDGGDRLYDLEIEETGAWSVPRRDRGGRLYAGSPLKNETIVHPERQVVTLGYLEKQQEETVAPRLTALEAAVAGKTRSYAVKDAEALEELLSGRWEVGTAVYYADELRMGDNVFVIDAGIPDFWFEATTDTSRAESITLTVGGTERTLTLLVYGYDNGGLPVGLLHVIEGEKTKIDFSEIEGQIGDVDAALDAILALQAELIGGEGA